MKIFIFFCIITLIYANKNAYPGFVNIGKIDYNNSPKRMVIDNMMNFPEMMKIINEVVPFDNRGIHANLNDYADKIFYNLKEFIVHKGFDPIEMPSVHTGFNYTFIITYHGELDLTKGWLQDLSTMHRGGDVDAEYSTKDKYLIVTIPIAFNDLQFSYDYSAKIMGLGPKGGIEGKISNIQVQAKIGFNTETLEASLDEFYIVNSGHISFHFTGHALVDWLLNLLSEVITTVLKEVILLIVETIIRGGLNAVVDMINNLIGGILHPATTTIEPSLDEAVKFIAAFN